jgi:hypothetical protein
MGRGPVPLCSPQYTRRIDSNKEEVRYSGSEKTMVIQVAPLCKCKKGHCLISIIHIYKIWSCAEKFPFRFPNMPLALIFTDPICWGRLFGSSDNSAKGLDNVCYAISFLH